MPGMLLGGGQTKTATFQAMLSNCIKLTLNKFKHGD